MLLSAKPILTYANTNQFSYGNQWTIRQGDPNILYFQVVDKDQSDLRYMVGVGVSNIPASINVIFPSIDDSKIITIVATQADASDPSIWKISILSTQSPFSGNVKFSVTEGSNTRSFSVLNMLNVELVDNGSC
jgi:hypothetical protein